MVIGKIWDSEYPWDVRVEKVCASLVGAGHQVELACRNRHKAPLEEVRDGIRIHRMPPWNGVPAALDRLGSFPAFINPRWRRHLLTTFRRTRVDLILCRDLPLAPLARSLATTLGVPLVLDIAEHYPGLLKDLYNRQDFRLVNLAIRNPALAALVERRTLPRADAVWVVVEEMGERLRGLGVSPERITVVSNTPTAERVARMGPVRGREPDGGRLALVYHGNVERSRGLATVLAALHLMANDPVRPTLDVFGDGKSYDHDRALSDSLGLAGRVRFHGRKPYDEILDRLGEYDAGIIPHHATDHWNYTIQNKFFDYMSGGLPLVTSSMTPAVRLLRETGAGVSFQDRDPASLRSALSGLLDPAARQRYGAAGRAAVQAEYNWTVDTGRLLQSIEGLCAPAPGRPMVAGAGAAG